MAKLVLAAVLPILVSCAVRAQNSTRKVRPEPSIIAARAGSAVEWRSDLEAALADAEASGRPVFWYVPTLHGSRMDRKPEIDRYMMAGPFTWPFLVELLNAEFVPVRQIADRAEQAKFDLEPLSFIEPGFVVLDAGGGVIDRVDEITTLAPAWFLRRLGDRLPERRSSTEARLAALVGLKGLIEARVAGGDDESPRGRFVAGACAFWRGDEVGARLRWHDLAAAMPDEPWAWKAAAEAEGHGPLVNGFEPPWADLVPAVQEGLPVRGDWPRGTLAPAGAFDRLGVQEAALAFFRAMQRSDGGFRDSRYDFGGTDSLPNVHVAVTALAAWAMLEVIAVTPPSEVDHEAERCLGRAFDFATDDGNLNRDDRDELVWAWLYRTRLCARWLALRAEDEATVRPLLQHAVDELCAMQPDDGAWYHEYPNPFVIASCLIALDDAKRQGATVPEHIIELGVLALLKCRADDGAITYGMPRGRARARIAAGAGRMPLAESALADWEHGSADALAAAVAASFEHHDELARVRKYDDHASPLGYGGFFFWYGMHARGEAIQRLADGEAREHFAARQRAQIMALPEIDGCFVDSHELGRVYGTAMALLCLAMVTDQTGSKR